MSRWERVLDGEGQVALIIGEAGIGKSRLLQRFHEHIVSRRIRGSKQVPEPFSRTRVAPGTGLSG
jgi:predicted ATPase